MQYNRKKLWIYIQKHEPNLAILLKELKALGMEPRLEDFEIINEP